MPVINNEAARKADALLEDQKQDWYRAHQIAILDSKEKRKAALEKLEIETNPEYAELIKGMVETVFENRKAKREASSKKATAALRNTFSKGKKRRSLPNNAATKSNVAQLINKLEQSAAGVNL